jgi:hypothetical protein
MPPHRQLRHGAGPNSLLYRERLRCVFNGATRQRGGRSRDGEVSVRLLQEELPDVCARDAAGAGGLGSGNGAARGGGMGEEECGKPDGRRERPRFTSLEVREEERQREAEVRSRRLQSSSSTDVFSPSIAVLPRDDGVRGGRRSRTQTREKSSSKANGFHLAAVLPLDTGVKGGRRTRTDTRQTTQQVPLPERTMRKGGKSDPTPTRKMPGGWD